jgi:hypothetical protein
VNDRDVTYSGAWLRAQTDAELARQISGSMPGPYQAAMIAEVQRREDKARGPRERLNLTLSAIAAVSGVIGAIAAVAALWRP